MTRTRIALTAGLLLALPVAATAAPAIDRGWPAVAPPGEVVQGPGGGPVVSSTVLSQNDFIVAAYRKNGRRSWFTGRTAQCGNCDGGAPTRLWPNGTYGPIGFTGDDFWAVDRDGRFAERCSGVVLADSTCVGYTSTLGPGPGFDFRPGVQAVRAGATLWKFTEDISWIPESDTPPTIVRDGVGITYVSFGSTGGVVADPRLLAINPDGTLRWRLPAAGEPLAALGAGVVVRTSNGLTVINADGTTRWSVPLASPFSARASVDVRRGRVYAHDRRRQRTVVRAFAAKDGERLWRSTASGLLSVGRGGRVYLVDEGPNVHHVRAIGLDGRLKWRFRAASSVLGAQELRDGHLAVSTGTRFVGGDGLLYRLNPRRRAPVVRRGTASLSRTTFATRCRAALGSGRHCDVDPSKGTLLRMRLPRASRIRLSLRDTAGRTVRARLRDDFVAPAGESHQRLLVSDLALPRGVHRLTVRWREASGPRARTFTIRMR